MNREGSSSEESVRVSFMRVNVKRPGQCCRCAFEFHQEARNTRSGWPVCGKAPYRRAVRSWPGVETFPESLGVNLFPKGLDLKALTPQDANAVEASKMISRRHLSGGYPNEAMAADGG
jgi:hypothetical protein